MASPIAPSVNAATEAALRGRWLSYCGQATAAAATTWAASGGSSSGQAKLIQTTTTAAPAVGASDRIPSDERDGETPDGTCKRWWDVIATMYDGEPQRRYHRLSHLDEMFGFVDAIGGHFSPTGGADAVVAPAIFFHDIVYDPQQGGGANERQSARLWEEFAAEAEVAPAVIAAVSHYIECTITHKADPIPGPWPVVVSRGKREKGGGLGTPLCCAGPMKAMGGRVGGIGYRSSVLISSLSSLRGATEAAVGAPGVDSSDLALFLDIDMAILGKDPKGKLLDILSCIALSSLSSPHPLFPQSQHLCPVCHLRLDANVAVKATVFWRDGTVSRKKPTHVPFLIRPCQVTLSTRGKSEASTFITPSPPTARGALPSWPRFSRTRSTLPRSSAIVLRRRRAKTLLRKPVVCLPVCLSVNQSLMITPCPLPLPFPSPPFPLRSPPPPAQGNRDAARPNQRHPLCGRGGPRWPFGIISDGGATTTCTNTVMV